MSAHANARSSSVTIIPQPRHYVNPFSKNVSIWHFRLLTMFRFDTKSLLAMDVGLEPTRLKETTTSFQDLPLTIRVNPPWFPPYALTGDILLIQIAFQSSNRTFHFMYVTSQGLNGSNNVLSITC